MIASVLVLLFFLRREGKLQAIFSAGNNDVDIDANAIIIETIKEAIPFYYYRSSDSTLPDC